MFSDKSESRGEYSELCFKKIILKHGLKIIKANVSSNKYSHYDFKIEYNNRFYSVDVKAQKKVSRRDNQLTDKLWIEFRGITGKPGWLVGKADFIAFGLNNKFLLVDRGELVELVERKVNLTLKVHAASDALYAIYTRNGREDVLTMILAEDLKECSSYTEIDENNFDKSFFGNFKGTLVEEKNIDIKSIRANKHLMDIIKKRNSNE